MTTKEMQLAGVTCNLMQSTQFQRQLTMSEVADFVFCLQYTITDMEMMMEALDEHIQECEDPECEAKEQVADIRTKYTALKQRASAISPILADQREQLEFLLAKNCHLLEDAT